jgi:hypothetical protein
MVAHARVTRVLPMRNRLVSDLEAKVAMQGHITDFSNEKAGAGGGTRTHTTLPSRDFKSLASTSSATSAPLFLIGFSSRDNECFPGRLPFSKTAQNLFTLRPSPV